MEFQLIITKDVDERINSALYGFFNEHEKDTVVTDYHIHAFLMYIQNKMLNIREGKDIDSISDRKLESPYI